jgi:hypothetical protein
VTEVADGYDGYYAERLWQLLPAVYRTADTDSPEAPGPLRELLNRIGAQVAVVRRSIDRLWADQSIETCDDWVISYLGDLLGTQLVNNLDARAQRLDVAKTIHYRRRKGTVQVLEELARDVTGWTCHVVEGFHRLARTRHGLDPALGPAAFPHADPADVAQLLAIEGLTGRLTGTPAGGFADLRSPHGAALANSAFDESFHTADVRIGRGALGHFGIPKLLVFLWRLTSFPVVAGTPVAVAGGGGQYGFDPTGREVPLFLPPAPAVNDFSEAWSSANEWDVPGPLSGSLAASLSGTDAPPPYVLNGVAPPAAVWPETGRFALGAGAAEPFTVDYQYGFSSTIGAGPYERDLLGDPPALVGTETPVRGGTGLDAALTHAGATGTVTLEDSLTYTTLGSAADPVVSLLVRAGSRARPVLRPPAGAGPWIFTGGLGAELVLDGLTLCGCDIVLRGAFDSVRLTACTVDPGTAGPGSPPLSRAVDGRLLAPSRIFIEADPGASAGEGGAIRRLLIDHCILGPIRTRFGGSVETLSISDSVVQGLASTTAIELFDPLLLAKGLLPGGPVSGSGTPAYPPSALLTALPGLAAALATYLGEPLSSQESAVPQDLLDALGTLIAGPSLYDEATFAAVDLSPATLALIDAATLDAAHLAALNQALLQESFPIALGVAALAVDDATVALDRVTVLGRIAAQRFSSSDSILADFVAVDDVQDGCVRFSACASGSTLPRLYESAPIPAGAPIFTSDSYGQPGYAQLIETADDSIVAGGASGASIAAGAENGSEMGAFSADLNPLKERGLLAKYVEYLPLGLTPVIVHVT